MTLEELHQTVYFDLEFILRKLDESVKNFGKLSLKRNRYPFAKKYTWKNYKSNISYNFYIQLPEDVHP
jgi:hypothetical protein